MKFRLLEHPPLRKIYSRGCQFVEVLIYEKDLLQGVVAIASMPRFFYDLDVFCLHNRRTKAIGSTEEMYHVEVMFHGMLSWERETFQADAFFLEHRPILKKSRQCIFKLDKGFFRDHIVADNVAKLQEGPHGVEYPQRHISFDRGQVHLSK